MDVCSSKLEFYSRPAWKFWTFLTDFSDVKMSVWALTETLNIHTIQLHVSISSCLCLGGSVAKEMLRYWRNLSRIVGLPINCNSFSPRRSLMAGILSWYLSMYKSIWLFIYSKLSVLGDLWAKTVSYPSNATKWKNRMLRYHYRRWPCCIDNAVLN